MNYSQASKELLSFDSTQHGHHHVNHDLYL